MKHFSHLNTAIGVIQQYAGQEPLHHFLKHVFSLDKKFGSKDRRRISQLCYVFYRVGRMLPVTTRQHQLNPAIIEEAIQAGLFLCSQQKDELLESVRPGWNEKITLPVNKKIHILNQETGFTRNYDLQDLFPWSDEISEGIEPHSFALSHLFQPDLFLRMRPGHEKVVVEKLQLRGSEYELIPPSTVRLQNGYKVNETFDIDREIVIQDLNSQAVGNLLFPLKAELPKPPAIWDCCAASGGKSIMMKDIFSDIQLSVTDVRASIIANLKKRFSVAGLTNYQSFITDLSTSNLSAELENVSLRKDYDLILADLPCTGSGTWSRTPEQLYFFQPSAIELYSEKQRRIVSNIVPYLKKSGKLLYVTCSVFKKENEEMMNFLINTFKLKLERMELLKGYDKKADTMFAAMLSWL